MDVEQAVRLLVGGEIDEIRVTCPDPAHQVHLTLHKGNQYGLCRISAQELFINPKATAGTALELALLNLLSPDMVQTHRCSFCHPVGQAYKPSAMERNFARSFGEKQNGEEESKEEGQEEGSH